MVCHPIMIYTWFVLPTFEHTHMHIPKHRYFSNEPGIVDYFFILSMLSNVRIQTSSQWVIYMQTGINAIFSVHLNLK